MCLGDSEADPAASSQPHKVQAVKSSRAAARSSPTGSPVSSPATTCVLSATRRLVSGSRHAVAMTDKYARLANQNHPWQAGKRRASPRLLVSASGRQGRGLRLWHGAVAYSLFVSGTGSPRCHPRRITGPGTGRDRRCRRSRSGW
jgi:hypothetical protein